MTPRIDLLRLAAWTGLGLATCLLANAAGWLAQRALVVVWPWIKLHSDTLTTAALLALAIGAVVAMAGDRRP